MRRLALLGCAAAGLLAAVAAAGDSAARVKGLGRVEVRWNALRYRGDLLSQLAPGLTWRIGKDGPTRLAVEGMALVGEHGLVPPGECTLNLRYWDARRWELVAFEQDDWKWDLAHRQFGVFPCEVWDEPDERLHAKQLELELAAVTEETRTRPPPRVVTGEVEPTPPCEYSEAAQAEVDAAPLVELRLRFGPKAAVARFEAVRLGETRGERKGAGGSAVPLRLRFARYPEVNARTELVATGTEIPLGLLEEGPPGRRGREWLVGISGGEFPELWRRRAGTQEELPALAGRRVETEHEPKAVEAALDGNVLTVRFLRVDYVFEL